MCNTFFSLSSFPCSVFAGVGASTRGFSEQTGVPLFGVLGLD